MTQKSSILPESRISRGQRNAVKKIFSLTFFLILTFFASSAFAQNLITKSFLPPGNIETEIKNHFRNNIGARFGKSGETAETAAVDPCEPTSIAFGQTVNGALGAGDCADPESGRFADVYIFNGMQGQSIVVSMASGQFDTLVGLFDLEGNVVALNDDADAGTSNSRIPPTGTLQLPQTGLYIIFATSFDAGGAGNYSLSLSGSSGCLYNLNPTNQYFTSGGGNGSFTVTTASNCNWQATSSAPWITTTSAGAGNGTVNFTVAANNSQQGRIGRITIGDRTFEITQGGIICDYFVTPVERQIPAIGGQFSFTITVAANCPSNVSTGDSWLTILNPQGTGTRTVNYVVAPNHVPQARNGTFQIGDRLYGLLQWWRRVEYSFDTGGQTNLSLYRPSTGQWIYRYNNFITGELSDIVVTRYFGVATDRIVPADYDGDALTDLAVYRDGMWYIIESRNFTFRAIPFGLPEDKPLPADFDGDQKADLNVYRPSTGMWYRINSTNQQFVATHFGLPEDVPLIADFNSDGRSDTAVYRPSTGMWFWLSSAGNVFGAVNFGLPTDVPVPADYDGDSKTDIAVFRPAGGYWFRINSSDNKFVAQQFGQQGDIPVPAHFDLDGKADIAVFRPENAVWYRLKSSNNAYEAIPWGLPNDKPIPAAYLR